MSGHIILTLRANKSAIRKTVWTYAVLDQLVYMYTDFLRDDEHEELKIYRVDAPILEDTKTEKKLWYWQSVTYDLPASTGSLSDNSTTVSGLYRCDLVDLP